MGIRGELFSTRLILPNRTYFFNVKENRMGDLYLNVVESKNRETGGFERQSVIVFAEDLQGFLGEFEKALKVLEKSVREQKRGGGKHREEGRGKENAREGKPRFSGKDQEGDPEYGEKRVVVRKREDPQNGL
ncbi:MAG: DUF3276 family protein [Spirochaetaceae bacterium]|jgi:hypothetical protein|nr:DUF3276 family protein [Spirochaetaceae bacterium]